MAGAGRAEDHLPLKPAAFHILLALGDGPSHGYAIRAAVEQMTAGAVRLWPVTLYGSIRELSDLALIEPAAGEGEEAGGDARRRSYGLTSLGRQVLAAETSRLRSIVEFAERTAAVREA